MNGPESARDDSPYRGLQPYTADDRDYFFGRDRDREIIISNLFASPLTVLYGPSGVGKSSVLLAGVVPELKATPRLAVVVFREWQDAGFEAALKAAVLGALAGSAGREFDVDTGLEFDEFLLAGARAFRGQIFFILDQFEEYFLYHPPSPQTEQFDASFARAVNRPEVGANFLLSMRDDGLGRLDRFRKRIPNLLGNMLRLEHLDRAAASEAIRRPLEKYNELHPNGGPRAGVEEPLVGVLLEDLRTGRVTLDLAGQGKVEPPARGPHSGRIETPFLQVVLERLWAEERDAADHPDPRERKLRLKTYEGLGRATTIVRTHLDKVMETAALAPHRDAAAALFHFLVTPGGQKIAHTPGDLASYTRLPPAEAEAVLNELSDPDTRILRPIAPPPDQPGALRYEISHDVLAPAILDWRTRYTSVKEREEAEQQAADERQRADTQARAARRFRRLSYALGVMCLIALSAVAVAAAYAVKSRRLAEEGRELQEEGVRLTQVAMVAQIRADIAQHKAEVNALSVALAQGKADEAQTAADEAQDRADAALRQARFEAANAVAQKAKADTATANFIAEQLSSEAGALLDPAGDYAGAAARYERALGLFRQSGNVRRQAETLGSLAEAYRKWADVSGPEALGEADESGAAADAGEAAGRLRRAIESLRLARELYRRLDRRGPQHTREAATLVTLAEVYKKLGDSEEAARAYQQAALLYREHVAEELSRKRDAVKELGDLFKETDRRRALGHYLDLLALPGGIDPDGEEPKVGWLLTSIGDLYRQLGQPQEARDYYRRAASARGDDIRNAAARVKLGHLHSDLNDKPAALNSYLEALQSPRSVFTVRPALMAHATKSAGEMYDQLNDKPNAVRYYLEALYLYRSFDEALRGNRPPNALNIDRGFVHFELAQMLTALTRLYTELGNAGAAASARGELSQVEAALESLPPQSYSALTRGPVNTLLGIGREYELYGDMKRAAEFYEKARAAGPRR